MGKTLLIILICISTNIFSANVKHYRYKKIVEFSMVNFKVEPTGTQGIDDFAITNNNEFVFVDQKDALVKVIDKDLTIKKRFNVGKDVIDSKTNIVISEDYMLIGMYGPYIYRSEDSKLLGKIKPGKLGRRNYLVVDNYIIGQNKNSNYFSFEIPDSSEEKIIYRNQEDTFKHLSSVDDFEIKRNVIFYNDKIIFTSGKTFLNYYDLSGDDYSMIKSYSKFLGNDEDGNYYFTNDFKTVILDKNRKVIEKIFSELKHPYAGGVRIDIEGNIYYCHLNEENNTVDLYKLERQW